MLKSSIVVWIKRISVFVYLYVRLVQKFKFKFVLEGRTSVLRKCKITAQWTMSKSKIPVRDLTPMFQVQKQVPTTDRDGHRSRKDRTSTFSANFNVSDRSKSLERHQHQRSNEKTKDLRNLVRKISFVVKMWKLVKTRRDLFFAHRFSQSFIINPVFFYFPFVPLWRAMCVAPTT